MNTKGHEEKDNKFNHRGHPSSPKRLRRAGREHRGFWLSLKRKRGIILADIGKATAEN